MEGYGLLIQCQLCKMLKTPIFKALDAVCYFKKKAFGDFAAFQTVLYTEIASLLVVGRIKGTAGIRTWTKR